MIPGLLQLHETLNMLIDKHGSCIWKDTISKLKNLSKVLPFIKIIAPFVKKKKITSAKFLVKFNWLKIVVDMYRI